MGAVGVEISLLPLKRNIVYTTACYRTSRDVQWDVSDGWARTPPPKKKKDSSGLVCASIWFLGCRFYAAEWMGQSTECEDFVRHVCLDTG